MHHQDHLAHDEFQSSIGTGIKQSQMDSFKKPALRRKPKKATVRKLSLNLMIYGAMLIAAALLILGA